MGNNQKKNSKLTVTSCYKHFFSSKDVRLPVQLQRAMAAEAEAAREARAKVLVNSAAGTESIVKVFGS
jgi:hypothetical protein